MKIKLQIISICLSALSLNAYGQHHSGIYMNMSDYKNNKLTYEIPCTKEKHNQNIHLHDFFGNSPTITVNHEGKKYTLNKNEIYGFIDCDNKVYRFFKNEVYNIAEAGDIYIYIYTQTQNIAQSKGFKVVNNYYFSNSSAGPVLRLTKNNLKNEFRNNDKFIELLDQNFGNDDINAYNNLHKTFKINYVYSKATK